MKWFIVVIFMTTDEYPLYAFTNPTFDTREECIASVTNPSHIPAYVGQLITEFGRVPEIDAINCVNEDIFNQLYMQDAV